MPKGLLALFVVAALVLSACGEPLHTNTRTYPTYGFFNEGTARSKDVCYELSVGNVVWAIILVETIIGPVYFVGFDLYNPVRLKNGPSDDCSIDNAPSAK